MASLKTRFGNKLKSLRTQKGLTQEQLADATELSIESISNIERDIFGPRFNNLEKIAAALNVEVVRLFEFQKLRSTEDKSYSRSIISYIL